MTRDAGLLVAFSLALLGGLSLASDGFFIIDEVIYFFGAHAFQTTGAFFLDNGHAAYGSDDLRLWLLRAGPGGLTPQYPPGTAILGGWMMTMFGPKGMMILNTLAAIATLFVTYALSRRLFDNAPAIIAVALLGLCTFFAEYAFAYWPHTISVLMVTLALWLFLPGLDSAKPWRPAFLAGLVIGASLLIRLDSLLILQFFALASILYAQRPVSLLVGGLLGLLPGLLLLASLNAQKFGIFHPLTYGPSAGGGTKLSVYAAAIVILGAAFGAILWVRFRGLPKPSILLGAVLAVAALAVLVPPIGNLLMNLLRGIDHILIDIHGIPDNRDGVIRNADRTTLFWGLPKKALAQSLPWLGLLAALAITPWGRHRRSIALVLMFFALWSLPFVLRSWHGGLGSNMRYLLPTVPALCALTGWLVFTLLQKSNRTRLWIGLGIVAGLGLSFLSPLLSGTHIAATHQTLSLMLFVGLAVLSLTLRLTVLPAATVFGLALGASTFIAASDVMNAQARRAWLSEESAKTASLPPKTLVYNIPEITWPLALDPDRMTAAPHISTSAIDIAFVRAALTDGYRVLVSRAWADQFTAEGFNVAPGEFQTFGLLDVRP